MASPRRPSGPSRWRKVPRGPYARVSASLPRSGGRGATGHGVRYARLSGPFPAAVPGKPVPSRAARGGRSRRWFFARRWKRQRASAAPARPAAEPRGTASPTRPARARPHRRRAAGATDRPAPDEAGAKGRVSRRPKSASHSGAAAGRGETSSTRASSVLEPGCPGSATSTSAAMPAVSFPASFDDTKASACQVSSDLPRTWGDRLSGAHRLARKPGGAPRASLHAGATIRFPGKDLDLCERVPRRREQPFLECGGGGAFGAPHPVLGGTRDPPRDPGLALRLRQADPGDRLPRFEGVPDVGQPLDDVPEHGGDHGMALARLDQHRLDRQAALHAPEHRPGEEREQRQAESGQHHPLVGRCDLEPLVEGLRARPARDRLLPEDLVVEEHDAMLSSGPICRLYIQQDSAHRPRHHDRQRGQRPDPAICTRAIYPHIVRPDTSTAETER